MTNKASPLFTFAVIADTHIMPDDESNTAPYAVLHKANKRARRVVAELAILNPHFVIHVGDMVRPFPALPNYEEVCDLALNIFQTLTCPVHYIPGNHDIGDKPIASAPAPNVSDAFIEKYKSKFGDTYGSFEHQGIRFILLNSSVINSGLQEEYDQWEWLKNEASSTVGKRCFLFIHYPPFLCAINEQPHYDNIDEPGRSCLLEFISELSVEAVFAGHVHHFFYNHFDKTDIYCLPSTSFTRHDFSELFAVAPELEYGRDDSAKLGYTMVDVYPDKHVVRLINTEGNTDSIDGTDTSLTPLMPLHPRDGTAPPIAVQLRHTWNEVRALPNNAPLDDFNRKRARNDYPILATWQMGISWLRVPLQDVEDQQTRMRMEALCGMGQRFLVMKFGLPDERTFDIVGKYTSVIQAMEIILPSHPLTDSVALFSRWRAHFNIPIYVGTLESSADTVNAGTKYFAHTTGYGYRAHDPVHCSLLLDKQNGLIEASDGLLFHVASTDKVLNEIAEIKGLSQKINKFALVHVVNARAHPASAQFDELFLANRTALACIGALSMTNGMVVLDTLMDIDRGDFPRSGLIDRRGNMNLSGRYLQTLLTILANNTESTTLTLGDSIENESCTRVSFVQSSRSFRLYLTHSSESTALAAFRNEIAQPSIRHDLQTGRPSQASDALSSGKAILVELDPRSS